MWSQLRHVIDFAVVEHGLFAEFGQSLGKVELRGTFVNEHYISARRADLLAPFVGEERTGHLQARLSAAARQLAGRRVVNVTGDDRHKGGVFEILRNMLPYLRGAGIDVRWFDVTTPPEARPALEFFHVLAHGRPPSRHWTDELPARTRELGEYSVSGAAELAAMLAPMDIVVLHDTQTAPLADRLGPWEQHLMWHGHIGTGVRNAVTDAYWEVLEPAVAAARARVVYHADYVPAKLRPVTAFIPPAVDPSIPKSAPLEPARARQRLAADAPPCLSWHGPAPRVQDGTVLALQVSRWDMLKDMPGVLRAFAQVADRVPGFCGLVVGPSAQSERERTELALCLDEWEAWAPRIRARLHVGVIEACGSRDHDEAVRLLQSAADIVVQKSIEEGFGLTVTEAMMRAKAVVASNVGGIPLQISDGEDGLLLLEPGDIDECATRIADLVNQPDERERLGAHARAKVLEHHAIDRQLERISDVLRSLVLEP